MKKQLGEILLLIAMGIALVGCGTDGVITRTNTVNVPVPGPTVTTTPDPIVSPTPTPAQAEQASIDAVVADENDYRQGLGQTELTNGLSCTLYTITGGQFIQNDATHTPTLTGLSQVATYRFADVFNQPDTASLTGLNVLPAQYQTNPTYQNLILLRCQGYIAVTDTNYYLFDLTSDDGSVLYLDGARLIDNDGNHGATDKQGTKYLRKGIHAFRLDFAQTGAGNQALILKANGDFIQGQYYFH